MNLINRDKVLKTIPGEDMVARMAVMSAPVVDAIPISFIVDFKDQYCYAGSSKVDVNIADALVELLLCWEERETDD